MGKGNSRSSSEEGKQVASCIPPYYWTAADERTLIHARSLGWTIETIRKELFPSRSYWAVSSRLQKLGVRKGDEVVKSRSEGAKAKTSVSASSNHEVSDTLPDSDSSDGSSIAGSEVDMTDSSEEEDLLSWKKTRLTMECKIRKKTPRKKTRQKMGCRMRTKDSSEERENIPEMDIEMEDEESGNGHGNDTTTHDNEKGSHGHSTNVVMDESCPIM